MALVLKHSGFPSIYTKGQCLLTLCTLFSCVTNKKSSGDIWKAFRGKTGAACMYKYYHSIERTYMMPTNGCICWQFAPDKGEQIWKQGQQGLCAGVSVDRRSSRSVARNETPGFGFLQVSRPACSLHHAQNGVHTITNLNRNKSISCPLWSYICMLWSSHINKETHLLTTDHDACRMSIGVWFLNRIAQRC